MSTVPQDLWLERSRFNGILLSAMSYGIFFLLTIQCVYVLTCKQQEGGNRIQGRRWILLVYIIVTFALATIGFAGNAKYSQTIWIDGRASLGGPEALIVNAQNDWLDRMALASYYVMGWFMDALLLYRCFVIWNRHLAVVIFMSLIFLGTVSMSIVVLIDSQKGTAPGYNNFQLAYLSLLFSTNISYTVLVAGRLLAVRQKIKTFLGSQARMYTSVAAMVVESAMLHAIIGVIYIITFALHSNVLNLVSLSVSHVQGIAQLLIILRVAHGQAFTREVSASASSMSFTSPPTPIHQQRTSMGIIEQRIANDSFSVASIGSKSEGKKIEATFNTSSSSPEGVID